MIHRAGIAQLVEHFTRNEGVVGSSPIFSLQKALCIQGFFFCNISQWKKWKSRRYLSNIATAPSIFIEPAKNRLVLFSFHNMQSQTVSLTEA